MGLGRTAPKNENSLELNDKVYKNVVIGISNTDEFNRNIIENENTKLVEFYFDLCMYCRNMAPIR